MPDATHTLYLAEKPSQGRDIARVLGARSTRDGCIHGTGVTVTWCYGHLLEMLPPDAYGERYKRWCLDDLPIIPDIWQSAIRRAARAQFAVVRKLLGDTGHVVIATDADREGETIARELLERCRYRGAVSRLWLSALNDAGIRHALDNPLPGETTACLYHAGLARARADWLVGMNLTRAYTVVARAQGYQGTLNVGRVQTPTLRLVVERDREIEDFRPAPYWDVLATITIGDSGQQVFRARWLPPADVADSQGRCVSEQAARTVAQQASGAPGRIADVTVTRERRAPPLPYDLGSLQQDAERVAELTPQESHDVAQALYERHKAITYPRTDCRYLPESMLAEAPTVMRALAQADSRVAASIDGADARLRSSAWRDAEITAHHAIIVTDTPPEPDVLSPAESAVFDLVRTRYLAQFYVEHQYDRTSVRADAAGHRFRAGGRRVVVAGWKQLYRTHDPDGPARSDDGADHRDQHLPQLRQGQDCLLQSTEVCAKQTRPPPRLTQASLIAKLERAADLVTDAKLQRVLRDNAGVGTPNTRAGIIKTLVSRGFLRTRKAQLISTEAGRALIAVLPQAITSPETTALWEQALDDIAGGRLALDDFVARQARWVSAALAQVREQGLNLPDSARAARSPCPQCGAALRRRKGKHGHFWGCSRYPDCRATLPDARGEPASPTTAASDTVH